MTDRLPLLMVIAALLVPAGGCEPASPVSVASPGGGDVATPASSPTPTPVIDPPVAAKLPAPTGASVAIGVNSAALPADAPLPPLPEPDASGYIETTFNDVKFEMSKTELFDRAMLTPRVNALLGKKIRIRGYMYPTLRKKGLKQFVLVRDNMECCFGPGAALFDCVLVTMAPEQTAEYSIRPIAVEGTLRLEELPGGPGGRPLAIYQMIGDGVQ
jgi:hypothetical protein